MQRSQNVSSGPTRTRQIPEQFSFNTCQLYFQKIIYESNQSLEVERKMGYIIILRGLFKKFPVSLCLLLKIYQFPFILLLGSKSCKNRGTIQFNAAEIF